MSITNGSSHHVRVVVRTKPTANFAQDLIKLEDDGKVRTSPVRASGTAISSYLMKCDWNDKDEI